MRKKLSILLGSFLLLLAASPWALAYGGFSDVDEGSAYADAVVWAVESGVTNGTTATTFSPERTCTRGQVVTFLWRAKGKPEPKETRNPFVDVAAGSYCEKAVLWAVEQGITNGTSASPMTFSPDATCTCAHIITFLWRANGEPDPANGTSGNYSTYYGKAAAWGTDRGILDENGFQPDLPCSRALTVTWLYRDAQGNEEGQVTAPDSESGTENAAAARALTAAELKTLNDSLDYNENGFFVCTYDRPEEIDWAEVFYNGAGISVYLTPAQIEEYQSLSGASLEIMGPPEAVKESAVREFVLRKTGTPYEYARRPLTLSWTYLPSAGLYVFQHGDTNMQPITFTEGTVQGEEYRLRYMRDDWRTYTTDQEFEMTALIRDGEWRYISNLPAKATAPLTLLDIAYCSTREEAQKGRAVKEFVEVPLRPSDEPSGLCWAVLTAREDQVRYSVDRAEWDSELEELLAMEFSLNIPDENITSGVLKKGESVALYISQPWYPQTRLMATKGDYYGEYWFGEDNYLHFENSVPRYVTGHDLQSEGRGCKSADEVQLANFLMDGMWAFLDPVTGAVKAGVQFYDYRSMEIVTEKGFYPVSMTYDRLDARPTQAPDLLVLKKNEADQADWSVLPEWWGDNTALGDYQIYAIQMDGEQILNLSQANNGDAVLGYLLGTGDNTFEFTLVRLKGTAQMEGQG